MQQVSLTGFKGERSVAEVCTNVHFVAVSCNTQHLVRKNMITSLNVFCNLCIVHKCTGYQISIIVF